MYKYNINVMQINNSLMSLPEFVEVVLTAENLLPTWNTCA